MGGRAEVEDRLGTPATLNHLNLVRLALSAAAALVGDDTRHGNASPVTVAENSALMIKATPGAFMFLVGGSGPRLHVALPVAPELNFNDAAIPPGVAYGVPVVKAVASHRHRAYE